MFSLIKRAMVLIGIGFAPFAFSEQVHIDKLSVGVTMDSVIEQPSWALVKEEGAIAVYTAWVDSAAALVIIEKSPESSRITKFSVQVPGGNDQALETFQALRTSWGSLHELGASKQISHRIACEKTGKRTITHRLSVDGLYELKMVPNGAVEQGVQLSTQSKPVLSSTLTEAISRVEEGGLSGADPEWNSAYTRQKSSSKAAFEDAPICQPTHKLNPRSEFSLGWPVADQPGFERFNGKWFYRGFFVAYNAPFADATTHTTREGVLTEITFSRKKITVFDFNSMVEQAKTELGDYFSSEEENTMSGTQFSYVWQTENGSVEMDWSTRTEETGDVSLRYFIDKTYKTDTKL